MHFFYSHKTEILANTDSYEQQIYFEFREENIFTNTNTWQVVKQIKVPCSPTGLAFKWEGQHYNIYENTFLIYNATCSDPGITLYRIFTMEKPGYNGSARLQL